MLRPTGEGLFPSSRGSQDRLHAPLFQIWMVILRAEAFVPSCLASHYAMNLRRSDLDHPKMQPPLNSHSHLRRDAAAGVYLAL